MPESVRYLVRTLPKLNGEFRCFGCSSCGSPAEEPADHTTQQTDTWLGDDADWTQLGQLSVLPINFAASIWPDAEVPNSTGAWALVYLVVVGAAVLTLLWRYGRRADA